MWSYTFQLKHKVDPDLDHWRMFGVFVFVCYRELFLAKTLTLSGPVVLLGNKDWS